MRNISDMIEHHLKAMMQNNAGRAIEIQRNELADRFQCVPSQINYVISTRFNIEKGYIVESKRGGGGYIRIQKIKLPSREDLHLHLLACIGDSVDQENAEGLIYQLMEADYLTNREANALRAAVSRDVISVKLPLRDQIRARMLKAMVLALLGDR